MTVSQPYGGHCSGLNPVKAYHLLSYACAFVYQSFDSHVVAFLVRGAPCEFSGCSVPPFQAYFGTISHQNCGRG